MSNPTPPPLHPPRTGWLVVRWSVWTLLWLAGAAIAGASALQILADSHRWDARVSLRVREPGAAKSATFRTLTGGPANVWATSLVHGHAGRTTFQGAVRVTITDAGGAVVREFVLGGGGIAHEQSTDSSWTKLAQVHAPRIWFRPWRLEARVIAADAAFPATEIDVILRKERPELGMGGMAFYVLIFVGLVLLVTAALLAIAWRKPLGRAPMIVTLATFAVLAVMFGWRG